MYYTWYKLNIFGGYTYTGWIGITNENHDDAKVFVFSIRSDKGHEPAIFRVQEGYKD